MSNDRPFTQLIRELDFLLVARRHLRARGPHFIVTHLDHVPGTVCAPGEMIGEVAIATATEPHSLRLSRTALALMDCLCRHRMPLSAKRIEEIIHTDPFYVHSASRGVTHDHGNMLPNERTVRIYVDRIRGQMGSAFAELDLSIQPRDVLVSEQTDSRILAYRLRATSEIIHVKRRFLARVSSLDNRCQDAVLRQVHFAQNWK